MFRFTIPDVLWLMVVVGLAIGWSVNYRQLKAKDKWLFDTVIEQEGDLQGFEMWILNPPEDDLRLVRLKEWATERRDKRETRIRQHNSN
jgi:hypothetical protein